jgi:hypothetical protein
MATLQDNPEFTANEVYEIQQSDLAEGAALGASFGGIGIDNQPHQQLANRTAYLKAAQDIDQANIGVLQNFIGMFTGRAYRGFTTGGSWIKIPFQDANLGQITLIFQWGFVAMSDYTLANDANDYPGFYARWGMAFPNLVLGVPWASNWYNTTAGHNTVWSVTSWNNTGAYFINDTEGPGEVTNGFGWYVIGF